MLNPSPEAYRQELDLLSGRFQAVRDEFRKRAMPDTHHILDRVQGERERLAAMLSDVEHGRTNWDLIRAEFGRAWNEFVADLELLGLRMLDAESINRLKA